jgi:hypothetical protein
MSDLFKVLIAHVKFLQEEHAGLVVQSSFDPTVARFFRTLQRGGGMSPMALENLRSAASIAAVYRPQAPQRGGRGGGFGRGAGSFAGRGRGDVFNVQTSRSFPSRQPRDASGSTENQN